LQFGRWSLLSVGIVYGAFHQSRLSRKEAAIREVELKQKAIRDEKLAAEKKLATEKEIAELEALAK
jgi:F-type H+-transporting ATPase subunit e